MNITGKRIQIPRWVHTDNCVVKVVVDAVIPDSDPSEPCIEPATVERLREIHRRAQAGDIEWLSKVGQVYLRQSA